jgi:hypothetical protein
VDDEMRISVLWWTGIGRRCYEDEALMWLLLFCGVWSDGEGGDGDAPFQLQELPKERGKGDEWWWWLVVS